MFNSYKPSSGVFPTIAVIVFLALLVLGPPPSYSQVHIQTYLPSTINYQSDVEEGFSVATNQQFHVTGKPFGYAGPHLNGGAVEIYDAVSHAHVATLKSPHPSQDSYFGFAVAISGSVVAVGQYRSDLGGANSGSVHVFDLATTPPNLIGSINNPTPSSIDQFGISVAIDPNHIVIGAPTDFVGNNDARGSVYIYSMTDLSTPIHVIGNPDLEVYGRFGNSVSISGNIIVAGDSLHSPHGAAYVFDLESRSPTVPIAILEVPDGNMDPEAFGYSVAVDGNTIVVSDPCDGTFGLDAGSAAVYDLNSTEIDTAIYFLTEPVPTITSRFGDSVAVSDNLIVVGSSEFNADFGDEGAAFVFDLQSPNPELSTLTLHNPTPEQSEYFGMSVAISGDTVVVGTPRDDSIVEDAGHAYVFDICGQQPGTPTAALTHPSPTIGDDYGFSISAFENIVVVGARDDDTGGEDFGVVYIYDTSLPENQSLVALITNPDFDDSGFGHSVSIHENIVVVGAPFADAIAPVNTNYGRVFIYDLESADPTSPALILENPNPEPSDNFGYSVSIWGNLVAVGEVDDNTGAEGAGSVHVFDLAAANPRVPVFTLNNPDPQIDDEFGHSVAIRENMLAIGAIRDDPGAQDAGSVYVYDLNSLNPETPIASFPSPTPDNSEFFGLSVAVQDNTVIVGAPQHRQQNNNVGAAYIYDLQSANPTIPVYDLINPALSSNGRFGQSVSISDSQILVGAIGGVGLVYVYNLNDENLVSNFSTIQNPTPDIGDVFGLSTDNSANVIAISAIGDSTRAFFSGATHIFSRFDLGDLNGDGAVDLLDVHPFLAVLVSGAFQQEADINRDGEVNLLDVQPFVDLLAGN